MSVVSAFRNGIKRVNGAPAVLAGVCLVTFLAALPLGLALRQMIAEDIGGSAVAADPNTPTWLQQFAERATGVGRAFTPSTFGFAGVVANLSSVLDNRPSVLPVAAAGVAYMLAWIFLSGGILDRYARNRRTRAWGFSAACGASFFRLLRLAVVAGVVYYLLFAFAHPLLFADAWQAVTSGVTSESQAFAVRAAFYLLFGGVLCACNLITDYARIRIVVEERRSAVGAIAASVAFAWRRPGVVVLYLLNGFCWAVLIAVYGVLAPGLRVPTWVTLLVGQAYLIARTWVKLLFFASETAFFQDALAHAGYTAASSPAWPDSPAADAIIRR